MALGLESFVPWVIAQNIGAAAFSIPLGKIADRFGNRVAISATMILLCAAPLLTIYWVKFGGGSKAGFYAVFFLLGLTPVTMRTFSNYTLEIAASQRQPVYLSTLGACMAVPVVLFSTGIGWLIDRIGFEPIFIMVVAVLFIGWSLTFGLNEPRTDHAKRNR
jgi:MFS family permease